MSTPYSYPNRNRKNGQGLAGDGTSTPGPGGPPPAYRGGTTTPSTNVWGQPPPTVMSAGSSLQQAAAGTGGYASAVTGAPSSSAATGGYAQAAAAGLPSATTTTSTPGGYAQAAAAGTPSSAAYPSASSTTAMSGGYASAAAGAATPSTGGGGGGSSYTPTGTGSNTGNEGYPSSTTTGSTFAPTAGGYTSGAASQAMAGYTPPATGSYTAAGAAAAGYATGAGYNTAAGGYSPAGTGYAPTGGTGGTAAAAYGGYPPPPTRMAYYSPYYGAQQPQQQQQQQQQSSSQQQQQQQQQPRQSGMWQPAPPTSLNPYANRSSMTYYPNTTAAASTPATPPVQPPKRRSLVITDKDGNVVDLTAQVSKPSSLRQAAAAGGGADAGAKLRQAALERIAEMDKKKQQQEQDAATTGGGTEKKAMETKESAAEEKQATEKEDAAEEKTKPEEEAKIEQQEPAVDDKAPSKEEKSKSTEESKEEGSPMKEATEPSAVKEPENVPEPPAPAAAPAAEEVKPKPGSSLSALAARMQDSADTDAKSKPKSSLSSLAAKLEAQEEEEEEEEAKKEEANEEAEEASKPKASLSTLQTRLEEKETKEEGDKGAERPILTLRPGGGLRPGGRSLAAIAASAGPSAPVKSSTATTCRKVYTKQHLLSFRDLDVCLVRPQDLPDMTIQLVPAGGGGPRRGRQSSGGGGDWARGAAPPARDQGQRRRGSNGPQEVQQWQRGQAPPKPPPRRGGGGPPPLYDGPVTPLTRTENAWKPKKDTSAFSVAEKQVKAILNKMTLEKFDKLSTQMCEIPILSYDILKMMIDNVYEKAIYEPAFGDMYADLCVKLSQTASASSFVQIIESDEIPESGEMPASGKVYRWSNNVGTGDGEIVGPYASPEECVDAALEGDKEPIERGDLVLKLDSLVIRNGNFVKIMSKKDPSDSDNGLIYYTVFFPVEDHEECGQQLSGIFLTEKECMTDGTKRNSFKRSLLNKCEDEFNKGDIYVDWKKEKKAYEETKDSLTESERLEKEAELEFRRILIKKQMLGNIKFIGQLYKKNLLKEKIMRSCIATLMKLKSDDETAKYPEYEDTGDMDLDEEDHEAICSMFATIGQKLDQPHASGFMRVCFTKIHRMSRDKSLISRSRFMYQDLLELRENRWIPRRKQEKAKTLDEIRKDVEREERQQAQQSAQAGYRGGGGGRGGGGRVGDRSRDYGGRGYQDDRRGSMNRQRSTSRQSMQVPDDDGFTQVPVRRSGSRSSFQAPADTSIRILKKPIPEERPERAERSPPRRSLPPALSDEKLERRIDTIRNEYIQDPSNEEELLLSMDELAGTPEAGKKLVSRNADRLFDCRDSEREAIVSMISLLVEKSKLTSRDVQDGTAEIIEFIDSMVYDCPRAYQYLGDLLSPLLYQKAVSPAWLCEQAEKTKLDPDSDSAEKVIKSTLEAMTSKYGAEEVKSLFGEVNGKLSAMLGADKWRAIQQECFG